MRIDTTLGTAAFATALRALLALLALAFATAISAAQSPAPVAEPLTAQTPDAYAAPYAGCVNYAYQAPAFRWGWFGVEDHSDPVRWHRNYNGHVQRWSVYRRY